VMPSDAAQSAMGADLFQMMLSMSSCIFALLSGDVQDG
jgi:hypothetical protein